VAKRLDGLGCHFGTEVGLGSGHIVLDGDPASLKRGTSPNFRPMSVVANDWMDQDATSYGGRPQTRPHCVRWGSSSPHGKGLSSPTFRPMSLVTKRSPISATAEHLFLLFTIQAVLSELLSLAGSVFQRYQKLRASLCGTWLIYFLTFYGRPME